MDLNELRWTCKRSLSWHGNRTAAELIAEIPTDLGVDRYGVGGAVAALEAEMCQVLAKPAAVFLPSGTMAQQIALRIHADRAGSNGIGLHPTSHLELHEERAYQSLHRLASVPIGEAHRSTTRDDLAGLTPGLAAIVFELPQRELGGTLPTWSDLVEQLDVARSRARALHLDGARLWECTPHYEKTPAEIAALFDSVYVSLYKGLGGLSGCCLAGDVDLVRDARAWRTRHGGTLFALWPYVASGLAALHKRLPRMPHYHAHALAIASAVRDLPGVTVIPYPPQTPMMHLELAVAPGDFLAAAQRLAEEEGLFTWAAAMPRQKPSTCRVELTVGDATLTFTPPEVAEILRKLVSPDG